MTYFYQSLAEFSRHLSTSIIWRNLLLFLLWLAVWMLGLLVEYSEHASVWFPAAGLTFSALLVIGVRAIPALLTACVCITLWVGHYYQLPLDYIQLLQAGLLFAVAHILPYYAGARILRYIASSGTVSLPLFVISFLVIAALSALLATVLVISALVISAMLPLSEVRAIWLAFWIGDMAGVIVIAPLFVSLLSVLYPTPKFVLDDVLEPQQRIASKQFKYKLLVNLTLLSLAMLLARYANTPESAFAIFFLVIPHMWIASTEAPFYNAVSIALSSFVIALLVNVLALMDYVMVYQFAINVIAANALFALTIPSLTAANQQLKLVASTDSLTRVASREHIQQQANLQISRSQQHQQALCLMVFDIDHFKQINDRYGHSKGDEVLQQACNAAQRMLRPTDVIGRFGGDEFVVILPQTEREAAVAIGQRIIERLKNIKLDQQLIVSASFGVAELQADDSFRSLFERADAALYRAKQQGRSQVAWH